ncbi:MAG: hypothetical protein Wins2KO_22550 [Winogradskyella sp.]
MKLREVADIIAFDQRGTGISHKLPNCPYSPDFELKRAIGKQEYVQKTTKNIRKCLDFWERKEINLTSYNTTESAIDIDDLRRFLGVNKISILGMSYGLHLAFEYIRLYEEKIDKVVLASLEGSDETIKLPKETEKFVFHLAKLAENNYNSELKYPELKEKIITVHQRLKDNPVTTSFIDRRGEIVEVGISNFELQSAIATFYLKNPDDSKKLPKLYSQMYDGDFTAIAVNVMITKRYVLNSLRPMPFAMDMQSGISHSRSKRIKKQINNSLLGSGINFLLYEWMTEIDFGQLPNEFREMQKNNVNALLFSGTIDGRTYLNSGKNIANKFKNGVHVIVENAGHDLFMQSPKIGHMVLDFFKGNKLFSKRIVLEPVIFD